MNEDINNNEKRLSEDQLEKVSGGYYIDQSECLGCGSCAADFCPTDAFIVSGHNYSIDESKCIECGACVGRCPVGCIYLS